MNWKLSYKNCFKLLALLFWCGFIYYFSSEPLSISSLRGSSLVQLIKNLFPNDSYLLIAFLIRKLAHFSEYLILAVLTYFVLKDYQLKRKALCIILFCVLYAISDEIHQYFVPGRVMSFIDVLIDSLGALTAVWAISKFDKEIAL